MYMYIYIVHANRLGTTLAGTTKKEQTTLRYSEATAGPLHIDIHVTTKKSYTYSCVHTMTTEL